MAKLKKENWKPLFDRARALIKTPGTIYLGPCVVQSPGAWTRVGPTWIIPGVGWLSIGPGAREWGTKEGLAELASRATANPSWHAEGVSITKDPTVAFACTEQALSSDPMKIIKDFVDLVEDPANGLVP